MVLKTAWFSDDAYITFRTIENLVAGEGPRFNVAERVQAYTHPLWMLLLAGLYALTGEMHYVCLLASILCSVAAVLFFAARVAVAALPALIGTSIFLLSKAFTDYSTSGLENPLTHLLLIVFLHVYLTRPPGRRTLLWLALLAALLILNRPDMLLVVLPALLVSIYQARGQRPLGPVLLGFLPLIAWGLFALCYYGALLPNTAYAKLNSGIPAGALINQGLIYLLTTATIDPLTVIVIAAGMTIPFVTGQRRLLPLMLGMLLYLVYTIQIGGDFMLGRFLAAPLVVAVVLLGRLELSKTAAVIVLVVVALIGVAPPRSPIKSGLDFGQGINYIDAHGICDERAYYYHGTGLLNLTRNVSIPSCWQATAGWRARERGEPVIVRKAIGMQSYYAGPNVHVVDEMALADPLLARLKPDLSDGWRIGHLRRQLPEGYVESLRSGRNCLSDPELAEFYERIRLVTRGPIWSVERWAAIPTFNLDLRDQPQPPAGGEEPPGSAPAAGVSPPASSRQP